MKIIVYTALFGGSDRLWSAPPVSTSGVKYVVFTEKPRREVGLWTYSFSLERPTVLGGTEDVSPTSCSWEQRIVKAPQGNRKTARYYKVMAHKVLREADISIWVDANVRLLVSPAEVVSRWASRRDLVVFKHPVRGCLFDEVEACVRLGKGNKARILAQAKTYKKAKMPRRWGLASTRCLVRKHTSRIAKLNEAWWKEICKYSLRDQISLPFVCWRDGVQWEMIPKGVRGNKDFWFIRHGATVSKASQYG